MTLTDMNASLKVINEITVAGYPISSHALLPRSKEQHEELCRIQSQEISDTDDDITRAIKRATILDSVAMVREDHLYYFDPVHWDEDFHDVVMELAIDCKVTIIIAGVPDDYTFSYPDITIHPNNMVVLNPPLIH